jgi:hypothetical protein
MLECQKCNLHTNVPSNFYDVCAEEIFCEQRHSHKCAASCRLSFMQIMISANINIYCIRVLIIIL